MLPAPIAARLEEVATAIRRVLGNGPRMAPPRWAVVARVEGEEAEGRPGGPITSEVIDQLITTFDRQARPVPILFSGRRGGNPHYAEGLPPAGEVVELARDARNLWARISSVIDPVLDLPRVDVGVADGFTGVSIGFLSEAEEVGGRAQLLHVAQASDGQRLGMANLPRLQEAGFGLDDQQLETLRSHPDGMMGMRTETAPREYERFGWRTAAAGEEDEVKKEEIEALFAPIRESVESQGKALEGLPEAIRTAVVEGVKAAAPKPAEPEEDPKATVGDAPQNEGQRTEAKTKTDEEAKRTETEKATALATRAAVAVRQALVAGLCERATAQRLAEQLTAGGDAAVTAYEAGIRSAIAGRRGQLTREVRVSDDESVQVRTDALETHSFGGYRLTEEGQEELGLMAVAHRRLMKETGRRSFSPAEIAHRAIELRG